MMGKRWRFDGLQFVVYILLPVAFVNGRYQQKNSQNACAVGSPGYIADVLNGCETYFYCHADATRETFACPFGMLFDERRGVCDTWNSVTCPVPIALLQENLSFSSSANLANQQPGYSGYAGYTMQPPQPAPYHVGHPNNQVANQPPATPTAPPTNPMDFLAALLFPPLSGQQDLTDFVNTAPTGVRQSFLRVAGEGHLTPGHFNLQPPASPTGQQTYTPYVEPLAGAGHRPVYNDAPPPGSSANVEGMPRRESPGVVNHLSSRRSKPSPAMNPSDPMGLMQGGHMQGGPPPAPMSYDTGPVPPHLMGGHSYMFGQLSMHNHTTPIGGALVPQSGLSGAGHHMPMPISGVGPPLYGPNAQVEALKPIMRSLMQNPYQPHLRRMASLLASGTPLDPMGLLSNKYAVDPMAESIAADPAVAAGGKSKKPGKALDDGLVDAKR